MCMARVLVIHSSPALQVMLELQLERLGHAIVADDLDPAVEVALVEPVDLRSLARALALRARTPDVPIVVLSAEPPSRESRALAPAAHLLYPFSLAQLTRTIADASRR